MSDPSRAQLCKRLPKYAELFRRGASDLDDPKFLRKMAKDLDAAADALREGTEPAALAAAEQQIADLTRERDEARDNQRKTYDNAVELRKYLEQALARLAVLEAQARKFIEAADFYRCLHFADDRIVDAEVLMCHHRDELRAMLAPSSPAGTPQEQP